MASAHACTIPMHQMSRCLPDPTHALTLIFTLTLTLTETPESQVLPTQLCCKCAHSPIHTQPSPRPLPSQLSHRGAQLQRLELREMVDKTLAQTSHHPGLRRRAQLGERPERVGEILGRGRGKGREGWGRGRARRSVDKERLARKERVQAVWWYGGEKVREEQEDRAHRESTPLAAWEEETINAFEGTQNTLDEHR